ncbi:phosphoribosylglycinamide formyltransferase [Ekhidna sp.]|uniref:phosphoribosylglycinamide formyltransferase n=1 Tax=Ekhidna sp. TaxID=2608089 RepID=UPI003CCBCD07
MSKQINLAIFASGSGTNAENIAKYFEDHEHIQVKEILSNKRDAFVHQRANDLDIPSCTFSREQFQDSSFIKRLEDIDYIILAGFLWLIPKFLIQSYKNRIINIHPALLPKHGGKGMYGGRVHKAVLEAREKKSGITIHLVNEEYDKGETLFQAECEVAKDDTPESLAEKIHKMEYEHFPRVIEEYIMSRSK